LSQRDMHQHLHFPHHELQPIVEGVPQQPIQEDLELDEHLLHGGASSSDSDSASEAGVQQHDAKRGRHSEHRGRRKSLGGLLESPIGSASSHDSESPFPMDMGAGEVAPLWWLLVGGAFGNGGGCADT